MNDILDNTQQHKQMTVRLSHVQYDGLQAMAVKMDMTVTECIRQCIDESLPSIGTKNPLTPVEKSAHLASIESMGLLRALVRKDDPKLAEVIQEGARDKFLLLMENNQ